MPDFSFDGPTKTITAPAGTGPTSEFVVTRDIYAAWKRWMALSDNAKWAKALSVVGGDPITDTQSLGSTFFLENGWRIRPDERDHKITLVGNLFTREPGESVFLPTLGGFTVNAETRVSSLVDSSVSRLDVTQLLGAVYLNVDDGVSGTASGTGTPTNPVNNLTDALVIAANERLSRIVLSGSVTIDGSHDLDGFILEGASASVASVIFDNADASGSEFRELAVSGSLAGGSMAMRQCRISTLTGFEGTVRDSLLTATLTLSPTATFFVMAGTVSGVPGTGRPVLDVNGAPAPIQVRNWTGGLNLRNVTEGQALSLDIQTGTVEFEASCTGGSAVVRGVCDVIDNSGPTFFITNTGQLQPSILRDIANSSGVGDDVPAYVKTLIAHIWAASSA